MTAVAAAKRHTVVLTDRGEVWTWGHKQVNAVKVNLNNSVDLRQTPSADGPMLRFHRGHRDVLRPVAVAIAAGAAHSSVLTATGSVLTWTSWEPATSATLVGGPLLWRKVSAIAAGMDNPVSCATSGAPPLMHRLCACSSTFTFSTLLPHRQDAHGSGHRAGGRVRLGGPSQGRRPLIFSNPGPNLVCNTLLRTPQPTGPLAGALGGRPRQQPTAWKQPGKLLIPNGHSPPLGRSTCRRGQLGWSRCVAGAAGVFHDPAARSKNQQQPVGLCGAADPSSAGGRHQAGCVSGCGREAQPGTADLVQPAYGGRLPAHAPV